MSSGPGSQSARIFHEGDLLDFKYNALEGVEPVEYIPPTWDGHHAGRRLVDGLKTLRHMPRVQGPRVTGNNWVPHAWDWADLLAQAEQDEAEKFAAQRKQNFVRIRPSSIEIAHMEAAIA
jgi:hypothetical protein